jgi:two-component system sensor histidine kinase DesK
VTISRRWLWAGRALLVLFPVIVVAVLPEMLAATKPAAFRAAVVGGLLAFLCIWVWFWLWALVSPSRLAVPFAVAALTVVLAALTLVAPEGADGLVFAAAAAGAGLRPRRAVPVVIAISLLAGLVQVVLGAPLVAGTVGRVANDLVIGFLAIGGRMLLLTDRDLHTARAEIARLAAGEERLRVARDLHDLVGQTLTVAVLKSELVARQLPPDTDRGLRDELTDVTAAIRRSLDNVREAVAGYRQPGIGTELAAARSALRAAGIALSVEDTLGPLPTVQEGVLAWTVREGVTNVLKHSGARRCAVRLRREPAGAVLELEDDGVGGDPDGTGSGLRGIEERVAGVGGSFHPSGEPGKGFRLLVSVPLLRP